MKKFLLCSMLVGLAASTACTVHVQQRVMNQNDAVAKGNEFCRSHAMACSLVDVDLYENRIWRLNYNAASQVASGRLHLEYDSVGWKLLRADEPRPPPPPPPPPTRPPPPPPPLQPRPMDSNEAVRRGNDYCHARAFACHLVDVDLHNGNTWILNFNAVSSTHPNIRGNLHLEFNALGRNLVKVQEPHPPPPPRPPAPMNSDEALRRAGDFCHSRGYECQVKDVDLSGGRVWKINMDLVGNRQGRVHLEFDAYSRAVLDVNEDIRGGY